MPSAQFDGFCNLLRWYDLMQHTADSCKLFTPVAIPLPAFVPPPPPAASTRPAKSTAATSAAPVSSLFPAYITLKGTLQAQRFEVAPVWVWQWWIMPRWFGIGTVCAMQSP
jgi:hypothetical protein